MRVSLNWIKELTGIHLSADDLAEELTIAGLEVDDVFVSRPNFSGVVIGEVLGVEPIKGSRHLKLCKVNTGTQQLTIVCGAPNVATGQRVPVATVGAKLPNGHKIKKTKLMGVVSEGMICSEEELGLGSDASEIMVVNGTASIGSSFESCLNEPDVIIELSITPNRPDCLGLQGIAREIAIANGAQFKPKPIAPIPVSPKNGKEEIEIAIEDAVACPRYTARLIKNVKVGPSPKWLIEKLESAGVRSISNIVDITNFVMLETGQPLHAFDYDTIGSKIAVRRARDEEKFVTLDDNEHELISNNLLICDDQQPIAVAGVMGGLCSEVGSNTRNILLESAYFDPITIRESAKHLGYSTDASRRFERGTDPEEVIRASNYATRLFAKIAGGEAASELIDAYPNKIDQPKIAFRPDRVRKVLGIEVEKQEQLDILEKLECSVVKQTGSSAEWLVIPPSFRPDLTREIDLIEEVARIFSYSKIPAIKKTQISLFNSKNEYDAFLDEVRHACVSLGFSEAITFGMIPKKHAIHFEEENQLVRILNPLSEDHAIMRPNVIASLLPAVAFNLNRKQKDIWFYEIGDCFKQESDAIIEHQTLAAVICGFDIPNSWRDSQRPADIFTLKGRATAILEKLALQQITFKNADVKYLENALEVYSGKNQLGQLGRIPATLLGKFDIEKEVFALTFDLESIFSARTTEKKFMPISKFPSVDRDLAIVVEKKHTSGAVEQTIRETAGPLLTQLQLFDVYQGNQIPENKFSLAFSLEFQSGEKTLEEQDIDRIMNLILKALKAKFNAELR